MWLCVTVIMYVMALRGVAPSNRHLSFPLHVSHYQLINLCKQSLVSAAPTMHISTGLLVALWPFADPARNVANMQFELKNVRKPIQYLLQVN